VLNWIFGGLLISIFNKKNAIESMRIPKNTFKMVRKFLMSMMLMKERIMMKIKMKESGGGKNSK
jgi:hypothetical protein